MTDFLCIATAVVYGAAMAAAVVLAILAGKRQFMAKDDAPITQYSWSNYKIAVFCIALVIGIRLITMLVAQIAFGSGDMLKNMTWMWSRSTDVNHYLDIAQYGYRATGEPALFIVFMPLYPYMLGGLGAITGDYFYTGSLMSCVFLVIACYFLFKTARLETGEKSAARTVRYLMLFPSIFFAMMPMTEGLFLALAASFLYCLRTHRYWAAAVLGMLAALTRSAGVLLILPYLAETALSAYRKRPGFWRSFIRTSLPALLIPLGTVIYLFINILVQGDAFYFLKVQKEHWSQSFGFFTATVKYVMEYAMKSDKTLELCLWIPNMIAFSFGLSLIISATKRQRLMYIVYSIALFYFSMSVTWLLSGMRYALALLPCFMELGRVCDKRWKDILATAVSACALIAYTLAFASGGPVY